MRYGSYGTAACVAGYRLMRTVTLNKNLKSYRLYNQNKELKDPQMLRKTVGNSRVG